MAQPYLENLEALVKKHISEITPVQCKHFFSGAALYVNGNICISLTPVGLAFKLPEDVCEELIKAGKFSSLQYFDNSPIKKGYVLSRDPAKLQSRTTAKYMRMAIDFAL